MIFSERNRTQEIKGKGVKENGFTAEKECTDY